MFSIILFILFINIIQIFTAHTQSDIHNSFVNDLLHGMFNFDFPFHISRNTPIFSLLSQFPEYRKCINRVKFKMCFNINLNNHNVHVQVSIPDINSFINCTLHPNECQHTQLWNDLQCIENNKCNDVHALPSMLMSTDLNLKKAMHYANYFPIQNQNRFHHRNDEDIFRRFMNNYPPNMRGLQRAPMNIGRKSHFKRYHIKHMERVYQPFNNHFIARGTHNNWDNIPFKNNFHGWPQSMNAPPPPWFSVPNYNRMPNQWRNLLSAQIGDDNHYENNFQFMEEDYKINENENAWILIDLQSIHDFDDEWVYDEIWTDISLMHTWNDHKIIRKCTRIWEHMLCLCQFLKWIDSEIFHCTKYQNKRRESQSPPTTGLYIYATIDYYNYNACLFN